MFGDLAGISDALKLGNRVVNILDRLTSDPDVKRKLQTDGKYLGGFTIGNYEIKFDIIDRKKTALPAEIVGGTDE